MKQEAIVKIIPNDNTLETNKGNTVTYEYLIVCPGVELRYDLIPGAIEALDD